METRADRQKFAHALLAALTKRLFEKYAAPEEA